LSDGLARWMLDFGGNAMRNALPVSLLTILLVLPGGGCRKNEPPRVEQKVETKSTNPDGTTSKTTTETKQYGSTLVSTTERTEAGTKGKEKSENETVVGTVTEYTAGKKIVVLTGDGKKHDYDLDDKKTTASVDARVTVGTKIRLDLTRDNSGNRSIRAVPAPDR
jgi:hypothetical protein